MCTSAQCRHLNSSNSCFQLLQVKRQEGTGMPVGSGNVQSQDSSMHSGCCGNGDLNLTEAAVSCGLSTLYIDE